MREDWILADRHLSKISISSNPNNEPVSIHGYSDHLRCIGKGRMQLFFNPLMFHLMYLKCMQMIKFKKFK